MGFFRASMATIFKALPCLCNKVISDLYSHATKISWTVNEIEYLHMDTLYLAGCEPVLTDQGRQKVWKSGGASSN